MKQKINPLEKRERNYGIYDAYIKKGAKVKDLAKKYGISTIRIYDIIHAISEKIQCGEIEDDGR